jgi:hypothetical protein
MMNMLKHKPVTLLAVAHAVMVVVLVFELVDWTSAQMAAVEGLFSALGFTAAGQVTANARLDDGIVAAAKSSVDWRGRLTTGDTSDGDV